MTTGFLYDERFLNHHPGAGHPESPARLSLTFQYLSAQSWFRKLAAVPARKADEEWLRAVHSTDYIRRAEEACRWQMPYLDTPDVGISRESFETALLAAGSAMALADEAWPVRSKTVLHCYGLPAIMPKNPWPWGFAFSTTWRSSPAICKSTTVLKKF